MATKKTSVNPEFLYIPIESIVVLEQVRSNINRLLPKPIIRRNTLLLPAPLRFLTHASIRFHSIFKLALGFRQRKLA